MIAGVAGAICVVVVFIVALLAFRRSGRGCSKDGLATAEAGGHASVCPPYSPEVLRTEHGGSQPIPTRSATRDRETRNVDNHGDGEVSTALALPTTASTGDFSTEERAEFSHVFRSGVNVEGGATSVSDIHRPDAGNRGVSSMEDRGQSFGGVGVARSVVDPRGPINNASARVSDEPLPPPPPYELPPPSYHHLAALSETDDGKRECLATAAVDRPETTLEPRGAESGYAEPAIPARPSTAVTSNVPRAGLSEAFYDKYAEDGHLPEPGAGKGVDVGAADDHRRSRGCGVGVARAVMEAARDLAQQSPVLGISEAATLVSILVSLVSDSKHSDRESEARMKRCRSIVALLQRAGKVLGKVRTVLLIFALFGCARCVSSRNSSYPSSCGPCTSSRPSRFVYTIDW